jgi:hypothetical protein
MIFRNKLKIDGLFCLFMFLMVALFIVPGPKIAYFDGIPLSDTNEMIGLVLVLSVAMVKKIRRTFSRSFQEFTLLLNRKIKQTIGGLLASLIIIKLLLSFNISEAGQYSACYEGGTDFKAPVSCAVSFENIVSKDSRTRWDSEINFGPSSKEGTNIGTSNWNLGLINDLEFNVYPWVEGNPDLSRFPFRATWNADVVADEQKALRITYVGEGVIRLGSSSVPLERSYLDAQEVTIPLTSGSQKLEIEYKFDSLASSTTPPEGPYATLVVEGVTPVGPSYIGRVLVMAIDILVLAFFLLIMFFIFFALRRDLKWNAVLLFVILILFWAVEQELVLESYRSQIRFSSLVVALLLFGVCILKPERLNYLGIPLVLSLATHVVLRHVTAIDQVIYRSRGDDWMTYQAFARNMLSDGILRGAEDVFYYQPGHRYLLFFSRLIAGDSDAIVAWIQVASFLLVGVIFISVVVTSSVRILPRLVGAAALTVLVMFGTSEYFVSAALNGLTEIPTWIFLLIFGLVLAQKSLPRNTVVMSLILGVSVLIRPNQLSAMVYALLIICAILFIQNRRVLDLLKPLLVFVGVLLLPMMHNLYFGGQFAILPTGNQSVKDLEPSQFSSLFTDSATRNILIEKIQGFLNFGGGNGRFTSLGMPVFALMLFIWIGAVLLVLLKRHRLSVVDFLIVLLPFSYLPPHIFYDIWIYYPRHVVAFNVALLVSGCVVFTSTERRYRASVEYRTSSELSS